MPVRLRPRAPESVFLFLSQAADPGVGNPTHPSRNSRARNSRARYLRDDRDLEIRIIPAARVNGVLALIDQRGIKQEGLNHGVVALNIQAQTLALAEQRAGGQQG